MMDQDGFQVFFTSMVFTLCYFYLNTNILNKIGTILVLSHVIFKISRLVRVRTQTLTFFMNYTKKDRYQTNVVDIIRVLTFF